MTRRALLALPLLLCLFVPAAGAWTWPVRGPVLQTFSFDRAHPYDAGQRRGIAVGADRGVPVLAPAAGVVTFAGTVPTNGQTVTIQTQAGLAVSLTHLGSIAVARNSSVDEGAPVGTVGPSGTPEFDVPYVHLGIRTASDEQGYLDPLAFLPPVAVTPPAPAPAPEPAPAPAPVPVPAPAPGPAPVPAPAPVTPPVEAPAAPPVAVTAEPAPAPVPAAPAPAGVPAEAPAPAAAAAGGVAAEAPAPAGPADLDPAPVAPAAGPGIVIVPSPERVVASHARASTSVARPVPAGHDDLSGLSSGAVAPEPRAPARQHGDRLAPPPGRSDPLAADEGSSPGGLVASQSPRVRTLLDAHATSPGGSSVLRLALLALALLGAALALVWRCVPIMDVCASISRHRFITSTRRRISAMPTRPRSAT